MPRERSQERRKVWRDRMVRADPVVPTINVEHAPHGAGQKMSSQVRQHKSSYLRRSR
jgi:hypothetical protein